MCRRTEEVILEDTDHCLYCLQHIPYYRNLGSPWRPKGFERVVFSIPMRVEDGDWNGGFTPKLWRSGFDRGRVLSPKDHP